MNERICEWINQWMNEWVNEQTNERTNEWINEWMKYGIYKSVNLQMYIGINMYNYNAYVSSLTFMG